MTSNTARELIAEIVHEHADFRTDEDAVTGQILAALPQIITPQQAAKVLSGEILTRKVVEYACLSYNHSFGLMSDDDQAALRFQAHEWARSIFRAIAEQESET